MSQVLRNTDFASLVLRISSDIVEIYHHPMISNEQELKGLRDQIDKLDRELLDLLNRRGRIALDIAACKGDHVSNDGDCYYYRPAREAEILRGLLAINEGPLSSSDVAKLFQEIMSACRALQKTLSIAFLGPQGTFTEAAAFRHFGQFVKTVPFDAIDTVFREVESGNCNYGVVPVENSSEGVVNHTLDIFVRSPLLICGEVMLRIHHHLLALSSENFDIGHVKKIYSHQQSLAQCRKWLDLHLPTADRIAVASNAEGARRASLESEAATIAGSIAAEIYGLRMLASNIEDEPNNTTRFLVISSQKVPRTGKDKTSLLLSAKDRPGTLFSLIEPLAKRKISMTRIESRPARSGLWEYVFFVDIEGHEQDPNIAEALREIEQNTILFKILGSYPRALI
uniref:Bifunctional chorismate mutase/prephenate dehydratase n=1 Tax=Candidatus Kentrum sp. TUN TaxID=2126343 RepID=A0A450ZLT4_9GAMM|nr:MAG: chorismate mutase / prephenate dehydratase [Candidatus Kentron sp. TUN]VFK58912.1 MAG: chorismate mutase / prephenate dehydratase [Candidatus Kentron sp. TUN]VFK59444.1 MAG: chorismate mutase / prephenate dehydratase [Candidatus Kentron sp. TUN]